MKEKIVPLGKRESEESRGFVTQVTTVVNQTASGVDTYIAPVRSNILKRFPIVFSLLVTLGASATFLGVERLVTEIKILNDNPWLMLILGITTLAFTGTLYKKLS